MLPPHYGVCWCSSGNVSLQTIGIRSLKWMIFFSVIVTRLISSSHCLTGFWRSFLGCKAPWASRWPVTCIDPLRASSALPKKCFHILSRWHKISCKLWFGLLLNTLSCLLCRLVWTSVVIKPELLASAIAYQLLREVSGPWHYFV